MPIVQLFINETKASSKETYRMER